MDRLPEALEAAEKVVELDPEDGYNHLVVGRYAYRANALEKSVEASRRALELNPNMAMAAFNLGLVLIVLQQAPNDIDAYDRGCLLCAQLDKEIALVNFDGALADLDALILERPHLIARAEVAKKLLRRARESNLDRSQ